MRLVASPAPETAAASVPPATPVAAPTDRVPSRSARNPPASPIRGTGNSGRSGDPRARWQARPARG